MEPVFEVREDTTLTAVRRRGLLYLNYVFWALTLAGLLVLANLCSALFERWLRFLEGARHTLGYEPPTSGPDYWILGGGAAAVFALLIVLFALWFVYRRAWTRRLNSVWRNGHRSRFARIRPLPAMASDSRLANQAAYLRALAVTPEWEGVALGPGAGSAREDYAHHAAALLNSIETEIAQRAVTAGLVVGLNRNSIIDTVSILAAALELQFFVLTRLGKRPSVRTWFEMFTRTGASLFLNWYISRGDALYLKLAIKKTAWGLSVTSDVASEAAHSLEDVDWDEVFHGLGAPVPEPALQVMSALGNVAAKGMTIGAFGLRQLGIFIESTTDDLLQGVLAGGILYYHGMALAAECLALDRVHRNSPEMNRTISQAMTVACAPAGRVLLDQVRAMRRFLRDRRRIMFTAATGTAKQAAVSAMGGVRTASSRMVDNFKTTMQKAGASVTTAYDRLAKVDKPESQDATR